MSTTTVLVIVFSALFTVLMSATALSFFLKRRRQGESEVLNNLHDRIMAWWVIILMLGAALCFGSLGLIILFCFVSFQALREFISLTYTRRSDHISLLVSFFIFLPLQYYLIAIEWYGLFTILIPVYAFLLLPIFATLGGDTTRFLERTSKVQWSLMVGVYCLSHIPAIMTLQIPGYEERTILLIVFLILIVQSSDVFQYIWGKLLGKHKISPEISPSKTIEGLIGGIVSSSILGACLWSITPFSPLEAAGIAFIITVFGFFGGFVLSAIKRDRGVKDWGHLIKGHGGMLDRVDSLSFAAPIFFHIVRYWWG